MEEYVALETVKTADHFDGLANARTTKPKRQLDADVKIAEKPAFVQSGGDGQSDELGQVEGADMRAQQGLVTLGANTRLSHRFDPETLQKILSFDTAEKTQAFVRELKRTPLMASGELPPTSSTQAEQKRRADFRETLLGPLHALKELRGVAFEEVLDRQRRSFAAGGKRDEDAPLSAA